MIAWGTFSSGLEAFAYFLIWGLIVSGLLHGDLLFGNFTVSLTSVLFLMHLNVVTALCSWCLVVVLITDRK